MCDSTEELLEGTSVGAGADFGLMDSGGSTAFGGNGNGISAGGARGGGGLGISVGVDMLKINKKIKE
jgi:hypothetical protein